MSTRAIAILALTIAGCAAATPPPAPPPPADPPTPAHVACATQETLPAAAFRNIATRELETQVLGKNLPELPAGQGGYGAWKLAVGVNGHVDEIETLRPVPGNLAIVTSLCRWTFKPQATPVRSVLQMSFKPFPRDPPRFR